MNEEAPNAYEQRKQNRLDYYEKKLAEVQSALENGDLPPDKLSALYKQRDYYQDKVNSIRHNKAISSDDPDALLKLEEKLQKCKDLQKRMKDANAAIRKNAKKGRDAQIEALKGMGFEDKTIKLLLEPEFGRAGFQSFSLANNNAEIRRLTQRIGELKNRRAMEHKSYEIKGVSFEEDPEDNRLKLYFDGKPERAVIDGLKHLGFRWSHRNQAWQGSLKGYYIRKARELVEAHFPEVAQANPEKDEESAVNEKSGEAANG